MGWGLFAGIAGVAAVGAVAYLTKDKIAAGLTSALDELEFVSDLADFNKCKERVQQLIEVKGLVFRCFYLELPPGKEAQSCSCTFISLPPADTAHLFVPIRFAAETEIKAHTEMFKSTYAEYYTIGSNSISLILEMLSQFPQQGKNATTMAEELDLD
ncbi:hypothetical protein DFQ28_006007 [Apophysomyces sp. BC1034]|nr:hypothetical protein DFQ28_006007 [Apophysomyces sp. BC1034]